jgi:hypothetical protein
LLLRGEVKEGDHVTVVMDEESKKLKFRTEPTADSPLSEPASQQGS